VNFNSQIGCQTALGATLPRPSQDLDRWQTQRLSKTAQAAASANLSRRNARPYIQRLNFEEGTTMFRRSMFAGAALVALCTAIPGAHASPPTKITSPVDFILFDSCSGEDVHFVGTEIASTAFSINNDIAHVQVHDNAQINGTGLASNASYKIIDFIANLEENVKMTGGTIEVNIVLNEPIIGQGSIPNQSLRSTVHFTVNAKGIVTVSRSDFSIVCHG
jgi:Tfp pilus assembly major pilin PilA